MSGKNNGGFAGGAKYLDQKFWDGTVSSIEGFVDFLASSVATGLDALGVEGAGEFAEKQLKDPWRDYNDADEWYNPGNGMLIAGQVAQGIGNSLPAIGLTLLTGGVSSIARLTPTVARAVSFAASTGYTFGSAGGMALKEAYDKTGKLDDEEWKYAAASGALESGLELTGDILGTGTGAAKSGITEMLTGEGLRRSGSVIAIRGAYAELVDQITGLPASPVAKLAFSPIIKLIKFTSTPAFAGFAGEALEEGLSAYLTPMLQKITYDPNAESATPEEIWMSAMIGGLSGAILGVNVDTVGRVWKTSKKIINGANKEKNNGIKSLLDRAKSIIDFEHKEETQNGVLNELEEIYEAVKDALGEDFDDEQKPSEIPSEDENTEGPIIIPPDDENTEGPIIIPPDDENTDGPIIIPPEDENTEGPIIIPPADDSASDTTQTPPADDSTEQAPPADEKTDDAESTPPTTDDVEDDYGTVDRPPDNYNDELNPEEPEGSDGAETPDDESDAHIADMKAAQQERQAFIAKIKSVHDDRIKSYQKYNPKTLTYCREYTDKYGKKYTLSYLEYERFGVKHYVTIETYHYSGITEVRESYINKLGLKKNLAKRYDENGTYKGWYYMDDTEYIDAEWISDKTSELLRGIGDVVRSAIKGGQRVSSSLKKSADDFSNTLNELNAQAKSASDARKENRREKLTAIRGDLKAKSEALLAEIDKSISSVKANSKTSIDLSAFRKTVEGNVSDIISNIDNALTSAGKTAREGVTKAKRKLTLKEKKLVGELDFLVTQAAFQPMFTKTAVRIISDPEKTVDAYNKFYEKLGSKKRITVDQLMDGIKLNGTKRQYRESLSRAMQNNPILRDMIILETVSNITAEANSMAMQNAYSDTMSDSDIIAISSDQFVENLISKGNEQNIQSYLDMLGATDVSQVTNMTATQRAEIITNARNNGQINTNLRAIEELRRNRRTKGKDLPASYYQIGEGTTHYENDQFNIGVWRKGNTYIVYDYNANRATRSLTADEMQKLMWDIKKEYRVKTAEKSEAATERDGGTRNALRDEESSARGIMLNDGDLITISNVTLDKPDTDLVLPARAQPTGAQSAPMSLIEQKRLENTVKTKVGFSRLSEVKKSKVDAALKSAISANLSAADAQSIALFTARSGMDVVVDDSIPANSNAVYDGKNTIKISSKIDADRTYPQLLAHEMSHKILSTYGENTNTKKLIMLAWENTPEVQRKEIRDRYLKEHLKDGKTEQQFDRESIHEDEVAAAYAEEVFKDPKNWEYLISREPTLIERILRFFGIRKGIYKADKNLHSAADQWLKYYKELFDSIAEGGPIVIPADDSATSINGEKMQVSEVSDNENADLDNKKSASDNAEAESKHARKSNQFQTKFEANVDAVLNGTYKSDKLILIGRTPNVLTDIGLNQLPLAITANHIYSIAKTEAEAKAEGGYRKNTNYHGLGAEAVKQIAEKIASPVMIIAHQEFTPQQQKSHLSSKRIIIAVELNIDGKQVICPIEVDVEMLNGTQMDDVNLVVTYFDKNNFNELVKEAIAKENIGEVGFYYIDKKKANNLLQGPGYQLPQHLASRLSASDTIIRRIDGKVNRKISHFTQSQQFKRFFGDWQNDPKNASKVVNADGTPRIVYHGTSAEFNEFKKGRKRTRGRLNFGDGFYFAVSKEFAQNYVEGDRGRVIEAYVSLKNPYVVVGNQFTEWELDDIRIKLSPEDRTSLNYDNINEYLSKLGYDGIIGVKYEGTTTTMQTVVAFEPTQIKSATDNIGTFDKSNPDIRYALKRSVDATNTKQEPVDVKVNVDALDKRGKLKEPPIVVNLDEKSKAPKMPDVTVKVKMPPPLTVKVNEDALDKRGKLKTPPKAKAATKSSNAKKPATPPPASTGKAEPITFMIRGYDPNSGRDVWSEFTTRTAPLVGKDPKKYKKTKKTAAVDTRDNLYINLVDEQYGVQKYLEQNGVPDAKYIIQRARAVPNAVQAMIGYYQFDIFADNDSEFKPIGRGIKDIFEDVRKQGESNYIGFNDFLLNKLATDRHNVRQAILDASERDLEEMRKINLAVTYTEGEIENLQKEIAKLAGKTDTASRAERLKLERDLKEQQKVLAKQKKQQKQLSLRTLAYVREELDRVRGQIREKMGEARELEIEIQKREANYKPGQEEELKELRKKKKTVDNEITSLEIEARSLEVKQRLYEESAKPVFDVFLTKQESEDIVNKYLAAHPEWGPLAEEVYKYVKANNKMRYEAGLISQVEYEHMEAMYPHYVPVFRSTAAPGASADSENIVIKKTVKRLKKGYQTEIIGIDNALSNQTKDMIKNASYNKLCREVYDAAVRDGSGKYVLADPDSIDTLAPANDDVNYPKPHEISFFYDGVEKKMLVSDNIYIGLVGLNTPVVAPTNKLAKGFRKVTNAFKAVVTSKNPFFAVNNMARDFQDALVNSKHGGKTLKNYFSKAWYEILTGGDNWKLYIAMGGYSSSIFEDGALTTRRVGKNGFKMLSAIQDKQDGRFKSKKLAKYAMDTLLTGTENVNTFIEQLPRFAEFLAAREKGKSVSEALLASADVTTNFGRHGALTKQLNAHYIPFFNAAIQGFDKTIRNFTDAFRAGSARGVAKELLKLLIKAAMFGMIPLLVNMLLYNGDEDFEMLSETVKDNNYLIKLPNGTFIKIPKGRMASVLNGLANRTKSSIEGKDADWDGYLNNVLDQITPYNSIKRNFFSPFVDVTTNTTWYGSKIEGAQFDNVRPENRYDESTSSIAIAIGKVIKYSPKKIHYLIDQYTGFVGDIILPLTTQKAEGNIVASKFTIDPVSNNKLSDSFYEIFEEATYSKTEGDAAAKYQHKYLNSVKKSVSEIYDDIREIQNSDLPAKEKLAQVRALRALINETYKQALENYDTVTSAIAETSSLGYDDNDEGQSRIRYAHAIRKVYGSEAALKAYSNSTYNDLAYLNAAGLGYDTIFDYYFETKGIKSEVDKKGNTVPGSKRKNVLKAIKALNISTEQKILLLTIRGYNVKDGDFPGVSAATAKKRLLRYIRSLKLTTEEKEMLADACGFELKRGKIVEK